MRKFFFYRSMDNSSRKKSAEDIVPNYGLIWEGLNLIKVSSQ